MSNATHETAHAGCMLSAMVLSRYAFSTEKSRRTRSRPTNKCDVRMLAFEDIKPGARLRGLDPAGTWTSLVYGW
jgi:hypothetical protein